MVNMATMSPAYDYSTAGDSLLWQPNLIFSNGSFQNLTEYIHGIMLLLNDSGGIDIDVIDRFRKNQSVSDEVLWMLIVSYSVIGFVGTIGNFLVVLAVGKNHKMRTIRNVFVVNLAVADFFLCVVTLPLTLMELLTQFWPFGDTPLLCKAVGGMQATCIFVSTFTIAAIAMDRFQVIVNNKKTSVDASGAISIISGIWIMSIIISLPNVIWRTLSHHTTNVLDLQFVNFCYEDFPFQYGHLYYTLSIIVIQYCLPTATICFSHIFICRKINNSLCRFSTASGSLSTKIWRDKKRYYRTSFLLVLILAIFLISWLPFHIYHIMKDAKHDNTFDIDTEKTIIIFAVCHMFAMSSACSNPFLYGWLNENFRSEFKNIFSYLKSLFSFRSCRNLCK